MKKSNHVCLFQVENAIYFRSSDGRMGSQPIEKNLLVTVQYLLSLFNGQTVEVI